MSSSASGRAQSAATSINFVITAVYTVTFANAIYQVAHIDKKYVVIGLRNGASTTSLLCAAMCMVMALRFFFGNNNFMEYVFSSPEGPLSRLYHFSVTAVQSLILLASSYLVTNPQEFLRWLAALFWLEVGWYFGCLALSRASITKPDQRLDRRLVVNEITNAGVGLVAIAALVTLNGHTAAMVWLVFAAFLLNTAVDMKHNLRGYMGL
jgi:hypothetical protein